MQDILAPLNKFGVYINVSAPIERPRVYQILKEGSKAMDFISNHNLIINQELSVRDFNTIVKIVDRVGKNEKKEDNEDNDNENETLDLVAAQRLLNMENISLVQVETQLNTLEIVFVNNYLNDLNIRDNFLSMYYKLKKKQSILKQQVKFF